MKYKTMEALKSLTIALCMVAVLITACSGKNGMYNEFLTSDEIYEHTSTREYPRGDSRAVYAFADCNGDGIPELHVDSARWYRIYTCINGKVELYHTYDHYVYPLVLPLKDGAMMIGYREAWEGNRFGPAAIQRPGYAGNTFDSGIGYGGVADLYCYHRLDLDGNETASQTFAYELYADTDRNKYEINGTECPKVEWEEQFSVYEKMLEDEALHLKWKYVFPEDEWYYLDAMEENAPIEYYPNESREWSMYEGILSGDFTSIKGFDVRGIFASRYRFSHDLENGRSRWKYITLDCNGDQIKELFIWHGFPWKRYSSQDESLDDDILACFSYKDGNLLCWDLEISNVGYMPLNDGRVLALTCSDTSIRIRIGRLDSDCHFVPDHTGAEVEYFFGGDRDSDMIMGLSDEEWSEWKDEIQNLIIPEDEWKPASVFMPNRYPVFYPQG